MGYSNIVSSFIPPYILENLVRNGNMNARSSIEQSKLSRIQRSAKINEAALLIGALAPGAGVRKIYDCQNKMLKRVLLVREEGDPPTNDDMVNAVYEKIGIVKDYYKTKLNRNSINDQGMEIIVNIRFGVDYMNAFWDGDEMVFGDGDGVTFINFTESLDVIAHELAHGVTQFTSNLEYFSQSGALNEHFSDVFGSVITQYANNETANTADWLIGDEIMGPDLYGESLRSMKSPGTAYDNSLLGKDPQPCHMDQYFSGQEDNQGVHINSGIPNKAFYLVAMDIGTEPASLIWYKALQNLWSTANFNDAVQVIVESARESQKNGLAPIGSPQSVRAAFKDVGLPV